MNPYTITSTQWQHNKKSILIGGDYPVDVGVSPNELRETFFDLGCNPMHTLLRVSPTADNGTSD